MEYLNNVDSTNCVGKVFKSARYGNFKIVDYRNNRNVIIQFLETGYTKNCELKDVRRGKVKDVNHPTIYGVGYVGNKYSTYYVDDVGKNKNTPEYERWRGMLRRCYSASERKLNPSYEGCTVSDNFKSYEFFLEWCEGQVGFKNNWCLDKDILIKGNKVYSENLCVFLPVEINNVLTKTNRLRGKYPIGVHYCNNKKVFVAQINRNKGKQDFLGCFDNPTDAFYAYKQAKEDYLKELAEKWKDQIDPRAYEALLNYQVEITD